MARLPYHAQSECQNCRKKIAELTADCSGNDRGTE